MTNRYVRLREPEPYRAAGSNTLRAPVLVQTLKPKRKPARLTRKVTASA